MFLESVRSPEKFFSACDRAAEMGKPVVVLKTGRTEAALAAASAHTGALGSPDRLYDAMLRAHGVIRVDSLDDMLNVAAIVQADAIPKGNALAAILGSGGVVEMLHDAMGNTDLVLAELGSATYETLRPLVGPWVHTGNPLDYWPSDFKNVPAMIAALADDPSTDTLLEIGQFQGGPTGFEDMGSLFDSQSLADARDRTGKLVARVVPIGGAFEESEADKLNAMSVPLLSGIQSAVNAVAATARFGTYVQRVRNDAGSAGDGNEQLDVDCPPVPTVSSGGARAMAFAEQAGLPVAPWTLVESTEEALAFAAAHGYPIAAKLSDDAVLHKSESGGIRLGLSSDADLEAALRDLAAIAPGHPALIQQQVRGGVELIVGVQVDHQLGPFVLVGLGGIWTEILDEVVVRPAYRAAAAAEEMLRELRGYSTLVGGRGRETVNVESAVSTIRTVAGLALSLGNQLESMEFNPVIVTPERAYVVDAVVVPRVSDD